MTKARSETKFVRA